MTFAELRIGHMVDISFDARIDEIATLNESVHAWERRSRTNVQIDIETATIALGAEVFEFNSQTLVLYRGEPFPISQIRPVDSVTLVGLGNITWLVQLDAAHGFMELANADTVINGTMLIGTNLFFALDDIDGAITLPEGTHRIVVEGDNIETFVETITVSQGETTTLNLADVELRAALLHVNVLPIDAEIFINGELHDREDGPAHVEFGEQLIRVERYGFIPQEQMIEIVMPVNSINFTLVEAVVDSTLIIFTVPGNAQIFIDNVFVGYSTLTHTIAPGNYRITARLPGHNDSIADVNVSAGEEVRRYLLLDQATAGEYTPAVSPTPQPITDLPDVNPFPDDPVPPDLPTLPPDEPIPTPTPDNGEPELPILPDTGNPFAGAP